MGECGGYSGRTRRSFGLGGFGLELIGERGAGGYTRISNEFKRRSQTNKTDEPSGTYFVSHKSYLSPCKQSQI
jgi:hypothetical protein